VILTGNWGLTGSSPQPFITLTGCGNVVVVGNSAVGYSAILTTSGCTFATPIGSVPAGGTTGQSLKKLSNSDYDVGWV
jgi:hypothetical protein